MTKIIDKKQSFKIKEGISQIKGSKVKKFIGIDYYFKLLDELEKKTKNDKNYDYIVKQHRVIRRERK